MFRFLFAILPFLFSTLQTNAAGDGKEGDEGESREGEGKSKVEFTAEQQARVNDIEASVRKSTEERVRTELKAVTEKQATKDREQRERDEAEKRGEFDKVKGDLEGKLTQAEADLVDAATERDEYRALVEADVKASWDGLPEEIREGYEGADDDPLAKKKYMARMAKATARLTAEDTPTTRGAGPNPKPAGNGTPEVTSPLTKRQIIS